MYIAVIVLYFLIMRFALNDMKRSLRINPVNKTVFFIYLTTAIRIQFPEKIENPAMPLQSIHYSLAKLHFR